MGAPVSAVAVAPSGQAIAAGDAAGVVHVMANRDPFTLDGFTAIEPEPEPLTSTKRLATLLGTTVRAHTAHSPTLTPIRTPV